MDVVKLMYCVNLKYDNVFDNVESVPIHIRKEEKNHKNICEENAELSHSIQAYVFYIILHLKLIFIWINSIFS